jgi:hypothetical protein
MTVPDALHVEIDCGTPILDMTGAPILDMTGAPILDTGWVDFQADVVTETPITIFQGQRNGNIKDRVADVGTIKLVVNNSDSNSGGVVGYYSPDHSAKRYSFGIGSRVRVGITKDAVKEWFSQGRVIGVDPVPGLLSNKTVMVTVADWIEVAGREGSMPRIAVQQSVTDDQVIQTIVDAMDDAPVETDLAVGAYTYPYCLTDVEDGKTSVLAVLQRLAQCGLARIFITGGTTSGEILTYVDLYSLLTTADAVASFVDQQIDMGASRKANRRVRQVTTTVYPQVPDAAVVVLYSLTEELSIPAGQSVEFVAFFRDPNGNSSRSIAAVAVETPVVGTEAVFSSVAGSGSGNLNAFLALNTFTVGSRAAFIKLTNTGGSLGYLQLDIKGKGLYPYDSITYNAIDSAVKQGAGVKVDYDLPYHASYYTGKEIADNLLTWYDVEVTDVPSLEFLPVLDDDSFNKLMVCKPGKLISVSESVTGIAYTMIVIGREIRIWNGGNYIEERLFITPAQQVESGLFFTLDTLGQDDLDGTNTILAFG